MGERSDLEGGEPFIDATEGLERTPSILGGPYVTDLGPVSRETTIGTPYDETLGDYQAGAREESSLQTPDEVEAQRTQVEQTRAEMGETIDAIQEKLSPGTLAQQAKETVKEATVGKVQGAVSTASDSVQQAASTTTTTAQEAAGSAGGAVKGAGTTVVGTIRQNPVPAALAGIGVGWLIASARKQSQSEPSSTSGGQTVSQVQGTVKQSANLAKETAGQVARQLQGTAQQAVSQGQTQVSQVTTQVQQRTQQTKSRVRQMMQENPLAVGAAAMALGTAAGLAAPKTQQEDQLMGQTRETLAQKAQQTAQETAQKVESVAQEALSTAKEEAGKQGLGQ